MVIGRFKKACRTCGYGTYLLHKATPVCQQRLDMINSDRKEPEPKEPVEDYPKFIPFDK